MVLKEPVVCQMVPAECHQVCSGEGSAEVRGYTSSSCVSVVSLHVIYVNLEFLPHHGNTKTLKTHIILYIMLA